MGKYEVWYRKPIVINTDPQRRCYNGVNFSEETVWSEWQHVCAYLNRETAEDSACVFKEINPAREYEIRVRYEVGHENQNK